MKTGAGGWELTMNPAACFDVIADELGKLVKIADAVHDPLDETSRELVEALGTAYLAAERLRIESSVELMYISTH